MSLFARDPFLRLPLGGFLDDNDLDFFDVLHRSLLNSAHHVGEKRPVPATNTPQDQQPVAASSTDMASRPQRGDALSPHAALFGAHELAPLMHTDLIESESEYNIHVDLPGVDAEDLHVSIGDKCLLIQAERRAVHEQTTDRVHSMERRFGKVQRKIRLPANADTDAAQTKLKGGVLSVTLPKKAPEAPLRKLAIVAEN